MFLEMAQDEQKPRSKTITDSTMNFSKIEDTAILNRKVKNAVDKDPFLKYGPGIKNYFLI